MPLTIWERYFHRILVLIAVLGLIPRIILGRYQFIGQDGWWHLFAATQDNWRMFYQEWIGIAHPPLFYIVLRFVSMFSTNILVLRFAGILCGCASVVVLGLIAAKLYRSKVSALLVAAAYAFTWNMVAFDCELRAYSMALLFILLAFHSGLEWFLAGKSILWFGVYTSLAVLCEYYAVLFVAACCALLALSAIVRPATRVNWKAWAFAAVIPISLAADLLKLQSNGSPAEFSYLQRYLWIPEIQAGLDWFLLQSLAKELSWFAPFQFDPGILLQVVFLLVLPAFVYFARNRRDLWNNAAAFAPPLLAVMLLGEIVLLALVRKYPLGGEFRHQSIIAPFVFLSTFLIVDMLAAACTARLVRGAVFAAAAGVVCASFAFGAAQMNWNAKEQKANEYARLRALFPAGQNIYIDRASTILLFGNHHTPPWKYEDEFEIGGQPIVEYGIEDPSGHPVHLLRNRIPGWTDPLQPETYRILAAALKRANLKSAVFVFLILEWNDKGARELEQSFRANAPNAGLVVGRSEVGLTYLFVEFKLPGV